MTRRPGDYVASFPKKRERYTPEEQDFLRRRTLPFIDRGGTRYSLEHLLQEAYLQGLRDAVEATSTHITGHRE